METGFRRVRLRVAVLTSATAVAALSLCCGPDPAKGGAIRFAVSYPDQLGTGPIDGRLLVLVSSDDAAEPRFQVTDTAATQLAFGVDVEAWRPGRMAVVDASSPGYPLASLADLPAGAYTVQALLHRYETFRRADGHVVKLPMDRGEGQKWNLAPGNPYSTPRRMALDPARSGTLTLAFDRVIPPIAEPVETDSIKYVRIKSERLSAFWGRPMFIGANVLLPWGFDAHPEARYPVVIHHGRFAATFGADTNPYFVEGFRPDPPRGDMEPIDSDRFAWPAYNATQLDYAHRFHEAWSSPGYPRVLIVEIRHANPYSDDSYAVNSANLGPYGDAINEELIPYVERQFRGIGKPWARFMYGGATGGWEALGAQVLYPDFYNGAFAACPDPIDFRAFTVVNVYQDKNAYVLDGPWRKTPRPGRRTALGHLAATLEEINRRELVLGSRGRSGGQWDAWQAVFSPVGEDGYPKPIWDKRTGTIDRAVAEYWREHYDLSYILRRDWERGLGQKLRGKLHIYVGDMDNYYLNNAVRLVEDFLKTTTAPPFDGVVDYGDGADHCWNGDHTRPNAISRLRYHQMFSPLILERLLSTAPEGADLRSWRY